MKCVKCCEKSVAFWPVIDPDIPSLPYCRKHLNKAKKRVVQAILKACKEIQCLKERRS